MASDTIRDRHSFDAKPVKVGDLVVVTRKAHPGYQQIAVVRSAPLIDISWTYYVRLIDQRGREFVLRSDDFELYKEE